jgi:hypothetical protein
MEDESYIKTMQDVAGNIFYIKCILVDGIEKIISIRVTK